jgi:hypothetical protein
MASKTRREVFRTVPYVGRRISEKKIFIALPDGTSGRLVPARIAALLASCNRFRTIEDHASRHCARLSRSERLALAKDAMGFVSHQNPEIPLSQRIRHPLQEALAALLRLGYLVELEGFAGMGASVSSAGKPDRIKTLAFATRERPVELRRALESYIANTKSYGREVDFSICDDAKNRKLLPVLKDVGSSTGARILYAGREEKEAFAKLLEEKGIAEEIVRFCLFGPDMPAATYGANRNALLLDTSGEMAFSADDDTICKISRPRGLREGLRLGDSPGFMKEVWTYPTREDAYKDVITENVDFLARHEEVLAPSVAGFLQGLLKQSRPNVDAALLDDEFMESIASGAAKVVVSVNGSIGDSGRADSTFLLFVEGESRARLLQSELHFKAAMQSREMIRSTDVLRIFESNVMGSMFFGFDNRDILPPFFPVFRSEDALWGRLIDACVSGACFAHLPWLLSHEPSGRSGYSDPHSERKDVRPYDVIAFAADNLGFKHARAGTREKIAAFGTFVKQFGSMPPADFKADLRKIRATKLVNAVASCIRVLDEYPSSPLYWRDAIQKTLKFYEESLKVSDTAIPPDMLKGRSEDEAIEIYRNLIFRFGELLVWWPYIMNATKELKEQGFRLAKPVEGLSG